MGHVVVQNWVCSCTEFYGELLKADIRVECSILHFGLFPAVSCALVEGPLSLTTRPLHHHSSQTLTNTSRMTSKA